MDSRQPPQPRLPRQSRQLRKDRPSTLSEAWQRMQTPPRRHPSDLPVLPNWPPLPEDPSLAEWPSLDLAASEESHSTDAPHPPQSGDMLRPEQAPAAQPGWRRAIGRLRRSSIPSLIRSKVGITVSVVALLLIVTWSSLALRTANGLVTGSASGSAPGFASMSAAVTTTQTSGPSGTPSLVLTETPQADSQTTPSVAPPQQPLTLAFTCASGSLHGTGHVCVQTRPHAALSITVRYCDGASAKGLHGSATADASGSYSWNWPVRTSCAGPATATVTATSNGQSRTQSDTFMITQ